MHQLTQFGYSGHSQLNKREGMLWGYCTDTGRCLAYQYINIHYVNVDIYGHIPQTLAELTSWELSLHCPMFCEVRKV